MHNEGGLILIPDYYHPDSECSARRVVVIESLVQIMSYPRNGWGKSAPEAPVENIPEKSSHSAILVVTYLFLSSSCRSLTIGLILISHTK